MITTVIVAITCLISYVAWQKRDLFEKGIHYPYREKRYKEYWRILTGGFLHGSPQHLLINMYMLYMFGGVIENYFTRQKGLTGSLLYLAMYLIIVIGANYATGLKQVDNPSYRSMGASGATSGILFIYIMLDPWQMFLFPPLPAIILAIGYLIYSSWAAKNSNDNIDHMAHYYGGLIGVAFVLLVFPDTLNIFLDRLVSDFPLR